MRELGVKIRQTQDEPTGERGLLTTASPTDVTQLLEDWSHGDRAALDRLMLLVNVELRRLAHGHLAHERAGHTSTN